MSFLRLDLQFFAGEKTEKATPKKRQESRKKGQVAKSQDVNTAIVLFVVFLFFWFSGPYMLDKLVDIFITTFQDYLLVDVTESNVFDIFLVLVKDMALIIAPIMLAAMVGGVAANYSQVGFLFSTEPIKFKLEKIDPIKGAKRIFSIRALVEFLKSILKISFVAAVTFFILWVNWGQVEMLSQISIGAALSFLAKLVFQMGLAASIVLVFLAIIDYLYQKYDFEKSIRMSKQDIKDEYKNVEGDPQVKSKIKQKQREMAMQRMMQEVPNADVIITNPTHFAVALKYDESKMDAPFVVASGVDFIAQKIKSIAKKNNVVTIENRPLARALYDQTEIGQAIPEEYFKAVAEILAYVYSLKNKV
ncbi:flagellar biosynthesis protein FlhB [Bacillus sp. SCS-151]|uniref:flagellar biosynthesis protein FlhB n=1 Tax=Nanhaiella sioensis TaxID=3115293 RepID=UPI0039789C4B